MELARDLFNLAWFQGIVMVGLVILIIRILQVLGTSRQKLQEQDNLIELIVLLSFLGIPFIAQFIFEVKNIFWFCLSYASVGMTMEFLFDYLWYRLVGTRLYRYFKGNLLGFTSWFIFPYWAAAGLYFYGSWQFLKYIFLDIAVNKFNTLEALKDLSFIVIVSFLSMLLILGLKDFLRKKLSNEKGFRWDKYFMIVFSIWTPIVYLAFNLNNFYLFIYFGFTAITGLMLEGILSKKLRGLYGESFWLYYRYNIFNRGTSLLILPIWGAAALLAFLFMNKFLFV